MQFQENYFSNLEHIYKKKIYVYPKQRRKKYTSPKDKLFNFLCGETSDTQKMAKKIANNYIWKQQKCTGLKMVSS